MKRKKTLIASDSYKGCMPSSEVNGAIAESIRPGLSLNKNGGQEHSEPEIIALAMSDAAMACLKPFSPPGWRACDGEHPRCPYP